MPPCDYLAQVQEPRSKDVSILVLVDAALRQSERTVAAGRTEVSILVLVDAALRLLCYGCTRRLFRSFNPCFSGCRPATYGVS